MHTTFRLALSALLLMSLPLFAACGDDDDVAPIDGGNRDLGSDLGTVDAGELDAALGDGGEIDAAAVDASSTDAGGMDGGDVDLGGGLPDCEAQDARGVGACDAVIGVFFDGDQCVTLSGCSCVGTKCGDAFASIETCEAAYAECLMGPSCAAILCGPGSVCVECAGGGMCLAPGASCP
jgi:hypothetical protein